MDKNKVKIDPQNAVKHLRLRDRQRHFLGEVQRIPEGYLISIYCKKCKESLEIVINLLLSSVS